MIISLVLLQTLFVQMPSGATYMATDNVPAGTCVMAGEEQVVFEATNINECNEIELEPGCYRAELRGGVGIANDACLDVVSQNNVSITSALFALNEKTKVYVFRGGDGNPGGVNMFSGVTPGAIGGGASGLDSILVVGDRVWRAEGGAGITCGVTKASHSMVNMTSAGIPLGIGLGGKSGLGGFSQQAAGYQHIVDIYTISAGGGGAPNDTGGGLDGYSFISDKIVLTVGGAGMSNGGGDGGTVTSCKTLDCAETVTVAGGTGGKNVTYTCGGYDIVSYGGGGGGGAIRTGASLWSAQGGNGGSGSTGTSDVSFVRIYKM